MEGSVKGSNIKPETRIRTEELFELLKKNGITLGDSIALAGFLLSLTGLVLDLKILRVLAGNTYGILEDIQDQESLRSILNYKLAEQDGIPYRDNVNREDGEVSNNSLGDEREHSSVQGKES